MFKSRSFTQTISYRVSGSSNQKSRALYVHCRFVLCPIAERLSFCRIGCSGVGKISKGDKNTTVMFHVGPLTSNLEKPAQGKVINRQWKQAFRNLRTIFQYPFSRRLYASKKNYHNKSNAWPRIKRFAPLYEEPSQILPPHLRTRERDR